MRKRLSTNKSVDMIIWNSRVHWVLSVCFGLFFSYIGEHLVHEDIWGGRFVNYLKTLSTWWDFASSILQYNA